MKIIIMGIVLVGIVGLKGCEELRDQDHKHRMEELSFKCPLPAPATGKEE